MSLSIREKVGVLTKRRKLTLAEVSERFGCTRQNLSYKMRGGTWSEAELEKLAEVLGCNVEIVFTDKETGEKL